MLKRRQQQDGLLRELTRRAEKPPWNPSFSTAFRLIILIRVAAAMYTSVTMDCDEVFNYWEPLHFMLYGYGFQTWEYSPLYAIRSWFYLALHAWPGWLVSSIHTHDKVGNLLLCSYMLSLAWQRPVFFALRIMLGFVSSAAEARFYRAIVESVNVRVGRYTLILMIFSAGMWNAATTFLPSTFAMYASMLAYSFAMSPVSSSFQRTVLATVCFAAGAIVGWPFSIVLAVPFVFEELVLSGAQTVKPGQAAIWARDRFARLFAAGLVASLVLLVAIAFDSFWYEKLVVAPLNIVTYNILATSPESGPQIYGVEPWYFYLFNLALNFNLALPLSLVSLPVLAFSRLFDSKRISSGLSHKDRTSNAVLVAVRLAPWYIWLGLLSSQPHKEERFMFPAYPLLCFNAAVTLYCIRGWIEKVYTGYTKSAFKASQTKIFARFTMAILTLATLLSASRILAVQRYYHAPMDVAFHFSTIELPTLALKRFPELYPQVLSDRSKDYATAIASAEEFVDLAPLRSLNISICYGKEWYRFTGHHTIPNEVSANFIASDFHGQLPKKFESAIQTGWQGRQSVASKIPTGFNAVNREETEGRFVSIETCSYLVDLDYLHRPAPDASSLEKRYAIDPAWERVICFDFLDSQLTPQLSRALWLPIPHYRRQVVYGDYCLLRNSALL
ncbi:glycosyltransferase family 22 protein [Mixia osmundae IAM 14324]|uniref:glycosyltransferase family 22 protein n=1 Tax=Mixia osmundae (strain CBS 9802 / IAM 14324 / JCM 22182 / KY 12970) TaxID=764103 RepID=UPI0004A55488|nr:glycosyltransferase family 22 protein [Mixia osmundae IAM 14324]KEI38671.1 glycosyltransferase family 22 protein [Mixia osmundae IAM 14324]